MMRIFAISDLHADEAALDRLRAIAMRANYDAIIVAGDITNNGPVTYAQELLDLFPDNLYCVHGNMDPPSVIDSIRTFRGYVHGRKVKIREWNISGVGGSNPTPFGTPSELSEDEIASVLAMGAVDEYSILVSHPPPFGIFDNVGPSLNVGSKSVRDCIEKNRPLLVLCGHIHELEGQKIVGDTLVVKLGPAQGLRGADIAIGDEIKVNFISF